MFQTFDSILFSITNFSKRHALSCRLCARCQIEAIFILISDQVTLQPITCGEHNKSHVKLWEQYVIHKCFSKNLRYPMSKP